MDAQPGILGRQLRGSLRGAQEGSYEAAVKGNPGAPQSHGSRMVENVRAVFPQLYQKHFEQHGLKASAMAQHDLHLERSVLFITLVGKCSPHQKDGREEVGEGWQAGNDHWGLGDDR